MIYEDFPACGHELGRSPDYDTVTFCGLTMPTTSRRLGYNYERDYTLGDLRVQVIRDSAGQFYAVALIRDQDECGSDSWATPEQALKQLEVDVLASLDMTAAALGRRVAVAQVTPDAEADDGREGV